MTDAPNTKWTFANGPGAATRSAPRANTPSPLNGESALQTPTRDVLKTAQRHSQREIRTLNLIYHIWPVKSNDLWRWNVGRLLQRISIFNGKRSSSSSSSSSGGPVSDDKNRTTTWTYTADDLVSLVTVTNSQTGAQQTLYQYGTTLAASDVARNDVLASVVYADSSSVHYLVNRQSQVKQLTDQNGTVHVYTRDLLGRLTLDDATTLGTNIDNAVTQIARSYEVRGMPLKVTSLNAQGGIQNDVEFVYNSFRQLTTEYQEHAGAVNTGSTLNVQYAYADGSANTIRRTKITYPSGFIVNYAYNTGLDDALNRISSIGDAGGNSAVYSRIGADTVVQVDDSQPGVSWSLVNGSGADPYTGLDQFNRLADARWFQGTTDLDRIQHGYDLAGNRQWRKNTVADAAGIYLDEFYTHDGLYRLARLDRGQLAIGNTGIAPGTENFTQEWGLDATGNWAQFVEQDYSPPSTLTQTRSANGVNEIISITGGGWAVPGYDAAGNMTALPLPVSPATGYVAVYDAWNRLRDIGSSQGTLMKCLFDGLGRRINHSGAGAEAWTEKYYSDNWQVLDERGDLLPPARQTFVWGARYIDELVLREKGAVRFFALQDPNWNVTAVCDVNGAVQERYNYAAYGQPTFRDASFNVLSASQYQWETLFAGYRWDIESGLYAVRYRYFNPMLGVWVTRDPVGQQGNDPSLYEYCAGSPVDMLDPFGLISDEDLIAMHEEPRVQTTAAGTFEEWIPNEGDEDFSGDDRTETAAVSLSCGKLAHKLIAGEIEAASGSRGYFNRTIRTIVKTEGGRSRRKGCDSSRRPDVVLFPVNLGRLYEIKADTPFGRKNCAKQLQGYIQRLNNCCVATAPGTCNDPGTTRKIGLANLPANPVCGSYLQWRCKGGCIYYKWGPKPREGRDIGIDVLRGAAILQIWARKGGAVGGALIKGAARRAASLFIITFPTGPNGEPLA